MVEIGETKPRFRIQDRLLICKGKLEINTENTVIHEQFPLHPRLKLNSQ